MKWETHTGTISKAKFITKRIKDVEYLYELQPTFIPPYLSFQLYDPTKGHHILRGSLDWGDPNQQLLNIWDSFKNAYEVILVSDIEDLERDFYMDDWECYSDFFPKVVLSTKDSNNVLYTKEQLIKNLVLAIEQIADLYSLLKEH